MDRLRAYALLIDGASSGTIKHGEALEVELCPGDHRIRMEIDWRHSREMTVNGASDVDLRCRANGNPFLALLYLTIWADDYIRLERA